MVIVMKPGISEQVIEGYVVRLKDMGFDVDVSIGSEYAVLGLVGDTAKLNPAIFEMDENVEKVFRVQYPFKRAGRHFHPEDTIIEVGNHKIGGGNLTIIAGPCAIESEEQLMEIARAVKKSGANILRGGAFKPRTSPYSFQGMGEEGLKLLKKASDETGLPTITEAISLETIDLVAEYADIIQIGARNMQNFALLRKAGESKKPVLIKRGMSATIEEWLMAAEYVLSEGNENVILCERGIRTFEKYTRNTLDLSAVPVAKELTHLPIIVDPSHATGKWKMVAPMSKAAIAAGADGLMIEVHNNPEVAVSDGAQSLKPEKFDDLMKEIKRIHGM